MQNSGHDKFLCYFRLSQSENFLNGQLIMVNGMSRIFCKLFISLLGFICLGCYPLEGCDCLEVLKTLHSQCSASLDYSVAHNFDVCQINYYEGCCDALNAAIFTLED